MAAVNEEITPIKEKWAAAVKAYQEGYDIDVTQLPGFADLKAAVDEYNTAVPVYNDAKEAFESYQAEYLEPDEALAKIEDDAWTKYDQDRQAIDAEYQAAEFAAQNSVKTAEENMQQAYLTWQKADAELSLIANPTEAQKGAVDDLWTAYETARKAYQRAQTDADNAINKAIETRNYKFTIANAERELTISEGREEYLKDKIDEDVYWTKYYELQDAVNVARTDLQEKATAAENAYTIYASELNIWNWSNLIWWGYEHWDEESEKWVTTQIDAEEYAHISHENLARYVESLSDRLFGVRYGDEVRLVDFTVADMKAEIEKQFMEWNPDAEFVPFYYVRDNLQSYGLVGMTGYYQMQIDIAKAVLDNEEAVAALKKELTDGLASVSAAIAKVGEEADAAEKAYADANAAYVAKFADVDKRKAEAEAVKNASQPVINAILDQIKKYLSYEDPNTAESVAELKKLLEDIVTDKEQAMFDQETVYLEAVKAREDFVAEEQDAVDVAYKQLQKKDAELKEAQEELAAANEALLAEIDRISQQTDEVTE